MLRRLPKRAEDLYGSHGKVLKAWFANRGQTGPRSEAPHTQRQEIRLPCQLDLSYTFFDRGPPFGEKDKL
jgi:hypothetical protein